MLEVEELPLIDLYSKRFIGEKQQVRVEYWPLGTDYPPELVAVARTQSKADEAIRRHKLLRELRTLRDETRGKHPRVFWREASKRLSETLLPKDVRYRLKRAALGHRLRDSEDPRQLRMQFR